MQWIAVLLLFGKVCLLQAQENTPLQLAYTHAAKNKALCERIIDSLQTQKNTLNTVSMGYLGGFQILMAKHYNNPIRKWMVFKRGKATLEHALAQENDNLELRLLRWSIQQNLPEFLNYKDNIQEDRTWVLAHANKVHSPILHQWINTLKNNL